MFLFVFHLVLVGLRLLDHLNRDIVGGTAFLERLLEDGVGWLVCIDDVPHRGQGDSLIVEDSILLAIWTDWKYRTSSMMTTCTGGKSDCCVADFCKWSLGCFWVRI